MGTRSLTILKHEDTEIAVLYRQYDGYISGMGADIVEALGGKKVVNGISDWATQINGGYDMAVQLISWLKYESTISRKYDPTPINSAGGFYLYPPGERGGGYQYTLTCRKDRIDVECEGYTSAEYFKGTLEEFGAWIEEGSWAPKEDEED